MLHERVRNTAYISTHTGISDNTTTAVLLTHAPGAVETPLLSHTSSQQIKDDYASWKKEMGKILDPDDIARTILFAYQQPQSVSLREIVIATTKQVP